MSDDERAPGVGGGETLAERVARVLATLDGAQAKRSGGSTELSAAGRPFAVVTEATIEVALDPSVAQAALATPDARRSDRGPGWVLLAPAAADRFALDRAEAWLRSAHRRAGAPNRVS